MTVSEIRTGPGAELELPQEFRRIGRLAYNLYWSWWPEARSLFRAIDAAQWRRYRNPVELLLNVEPQRWEALRRDAAFARLCHAVIDASDRYLAGAGQSWFHQSYPEFDRGPIAYFSAEYGWHEGLQTYSGGLGILSGDHCKSASDLGLPFVGVGLIYHQGYFRQTVDADGHQQHSYPEYDLRRLPLLPVVDESGDEVRVSVDFPGRKVQARIWKADVGRVPVLLLDSNLQTNESADRKITSILYIRDREMRLCQEILLGVGGVRALRALGISPSVWHMNEGHSSLLSLERMRELIQGQGVPLADARRRVAGNAIFTTHTPVPAGNEQFAPNLICKYFGEWATACGTGTDELLRLGRDGDPDKFNFTALAIRTSSRRNAVSALHGRVANEMWKHLWSGNGGRPPAEDQHPGDQPDSTETVLAGEPIDHVTNGVHVPTWIGPEMRLLVARRLGLEHLDELLDPGFASAVREIPDLELWQAHLAQKARLLDFARQRVTEQHARYGKSPEGLTGVQTLFDPEVLTIGFARRFATYKRADLILHDIARLQGILTTEGRPVQLLFAGKAHPADLPGQEPIRRISHVSRTPELRGRVVFLENYDMRMGRLMVQGVDLWLNNPRRPHEASGTSGMKAAANGVLNCSVLDGWWCEGFDPSHGWTIGEDKHYDDEGTQDARDAESLYRLLAESVVPCFYERDGVGLPVGWIRRMKEAMATLTPRFSTERMLREYTEKYYVPVGSSSTP